MASLPRRSKRQRDPEIELQYDLPPAPIDEEIVVGPLPCEPVPLPNELIQRFDPIFRQELETLGFTYDEMVDREYQNEHRNEMMIRYAGMGHVQVVGINPCRQSEDRYFIGVLGGANALDALSNHYSFCRIGQTGTYYYTPRDVSRYLHRTGQDATVYTYTSVPDEE